MMHELTLYHTTQEQCDTPRWKWTKEGQFMVKSCYQAMEEDPYVKTQVSKIWTIKAPMRVMVFTWLLMRNKILTIDNLMARGWEMANMCYMCRSQSESVQHLFGNCTIATQVRQTLRQIRTTIPQGAAFDRGKFKWVLTKEPDLILRQVQITICFVLWRERCARVFRQQNQTTRQIAAHIILEFDAWFRQQQQVQQQVPQQ